MKLRHACNKKSFYYFYPSLIEFCGWIFRTSNPLGEFSSPTFVASNLIAPSFGDHIVRIILSCSNFKVRISNAFPVIAFVHHSHSFWNFTKVNFPRNAMRWPFFKIPSASSVSTCFSRKNPFPAFSKFGAMFWNASVLIYFLPKSFKLILIKPFLLGYMFVRSISSRQAYLFIHKFVCRLSDGLVPVRKPLLFSTI